MDQNHGTGTTSRGTDLLRLINQLEELVLHASRVPWGSRVMIEEEEILNVIDKLRMAMPQEIKQARRVVQDRQKIIADAQVEADKILTVARERAEYLMNEQGLVNESKARSEDILRQAREGAKRSMNEVDVYALQILTQLERVLEQNLNEVQQAKGVMNR